MIIKNVLFLWVNTMVLFLFGSAAEGAEIVTCQHEKLRHELRCVIQITEDERVNVGDYVELYRNDRYWVAKGDVVTLRGRYCIVLFENSKRLNQNGLSPRLVSHRYIEGSHWVDAFSHNL